MKNVLQQLSYQSCIQAQDIMEIARNEQLTKTERIQQILNILRSNPPLMAAFIRERQRQRQDLHREQLPQRPVQLQQAQPLQIVRIC